MSISTPFRRLLPDAPAKSCAACGRPVPKQHGVNLHGHRYHADCALYRPPPRRL